MAGCLRLPRRETERERGRSVKFIVINRSWLDKRGSSSKLEEEAGTKEEEKSGATEGRETRAYRYSSPSLPTDNKFPTKVSRFDVDKVVAPTRCPRAFASLSKFLRRALVHIYIYIPFSSLSSFLHFSCPAWQGFAIPSKSSGYAMQRGIAEVRVLALSARNYVRELWNFMYGVSVSKYANSIRPFLR